eukprot:TRINITY_DN10950_c0_g3_i2.p1 TRINITY_DN10950_c0_g3~~TRINITY_DN10950_c0_g3_i2.p1  ORF type:complete len:103 (+),score=5.76 TRINITY_DN10950_c0_g3_i2:1055-1363(+)
MTNAQQTTLMPDWCRLKSLESLFGLQPTADTTLGVITNALESQNIGFNKNHIVICIFFKGIVICILNVHMVKQMEVTLQHGRYCCKLDIHCYTILYQLKLLE